MIQKRVMRLGWPEGVATVLGVALIAWPALNTAARPFLRVLPYLVLVIGLGLGWRFGRGRLLFALVTLAVAEGFMSWLAPPAPPSAGIARAGSLLIGVLLPANLAALTLLPETPPTSRLGRWWWGTFAAQVVVAALVCRVVPATMASALSLPLFPVELGRWFSLPQFAQLAFLATAGLLGYRAWAAPQSTARGMFWAALAALVAFNATGPGNRTLYLSVAGLVLVVSMVEASYTLAFHDDLTGLPGRRAFNQALAGLGGDYVIAMVDVDHFKRFNDEHGHDVGDQVLRMVAGRLGNVGEAGRGFRYGGEEFAVVFPETTLEHSKIDLEALRIAIETATFTFRGPDRPRNTGDTPKRGRPARKRDLTVTVSIGAAAAGETPIATVEAADKALYRAKDEGRNRVAVAQ